MIRSAEVSPDGVYRYRLTRRWGGDDSLLFVMLNPSTADADVDDPTIRRCMGFAEREGFGTLEVANLYAFRATSPADLRVAIDSDTMSAIGPENDDRLLDLAAAAETIVVAWGSYAPPFRELEVAELLEDEVGCPMWCLGATRSGSPRHPLYVRGDKELEGWSVS